MRALEFARLKALLCRVFSRSATVTRASLSCIEAKTDLFTMLGAPGEYSGNNLSLGSAIRLGVSVSKLKDDGIYEIDSDILGAPITGIKFVV